MSNINTWFGWKQGAPTGDDRLPEMFAVTMKHDDFVKIDVTAIYSKILTDVVERTTGLTDDQAELLWDNCVKSSKADGLITLLSKAIVDKKDLFLVYDKAVKVIREATPSEKSQIEQDYKNTASSSVGVFISFKNYSRVDMVKLYSSLEFAAVGALNKSMNLSKAIQMKLKDLRSSVGSVDSADVKAQAVKIAKDLSEGRDVALDKEDMIETAVPQLTSVKEAIAFLDSKRAFYLGVSLSYITGEQTGGLGSSGENDTKAIERGLKNYYFSIIKPVLSALFGVKLQYKSQDFRQLSQALEALKTFALIGEEHLNLENQKKVIEGLLDIEASENKTKAAPEPEPPLTLPPGKGKPALPPTKGNA